MGQSRRQLWRAAAALLVLAVACGAAVDEGSVERLTQQVRHSVADERRSPNEGVLLAMRDLHDERLRPLFAGMALRDNPVAKLHGIFGLADLSPERKVNIVQIAGIADGKLRALVLGRAIGGDYLSERQMRQVLAWPELDPGLELLVTSKLMQAGDEVSEDRIREVAASCGDEQFATEVFALLLIAQIEGDSGASEARAKLETIDESVRGPFVAFAVAQILSEKLFALHDFVVAMDAWAGTRERVRLQTLATLLRVDPTLGVQAWTAVYASESDLASRIRLALVLLQNARYVEPSAFEPMIGDDFDLLGTMGRAGRAIAAGEGEAKALFELFSTGHSPSMAWALDEMEAMEKPHRASVLREILSLVTTARDDPAAAVPASVYEIARSLEQAEPGAIGAFLAAACDRQDAGLCEALLAALDGTEPHVAWESEAQPSWPSRRARILAVIAEARAGIVLTPEKIDLLVSAGTGGETLPPAFKVQAAWLALCQLGVEREALTKILAPAPD